MTIWNGQTPISSFVPHNQNHPETTFYTDASGNWGCGAAWHTNWIQCAWQDCWRHESIATKELLPIVLACVWGKQWRHKRVLGYCDNQAVVDIWQAQRSRHPTIMHLLRCMHFIAAYFHTTIVIKHIPGITNIVADAISRNNLQVLQSQSPLMAPHPTPVPTPLWQMLVVQQPDWLSPRWSQLWKEFLQIA